jgi:hypothetical protein
MLVNLLSLKLTLIFFICYLLFILFYFNGPLLLTHPFILFFMSFIQLPFSHIPIIFKTCLALTQKRLIKCSGPFITLNFINSIGFLNLIFNQF